MTTSEPTVQETTTLRIASANGFITRKILQTPPRDALPSEIPIIDIGPAFSERSADREAVAHEIRKAATNNGFFYITNHGIPESVLQEAYNAGLQFFRQDMETKMRSKSPDSNNFAGYFPPKSMEINPFEGKDVKEMFITRYDPRYDPDVADVGDIPEHVRKSFHYYDTPWEATLPRFKDAMIRYCQEGLKLTRTLMRSFALSLGLQEDYFDAKMQYPNINTNMNYYPPMPKAAPGDSGEGAKASAFGSHTDFQVFTVLWQDSIGGLQVLNREGQWINAPPIENTLIVNIADLLQRITNDLYVSSVHRAVNATSHERISMPLATGFGAHEVVSVANTCLGTEGKPKYDSITVEEWVTKRLDNMIRLRQQVGAQVA
ncbi:hypothetical protein QQS21_005246 [Conoideocrella luteorostrata]|uniref:Fe2OG dioxygenase domain-containing protein n=1 Tax=Conoideocrella luteorostrata TaxID=1105319 RepID=A0AAJ0CQ26_9HYPO|nr:hypothetical protein QQS21_005246 [Conoideocrella luteorostrata]